MFLTSDVVLDNAMERYSQVSVIMQLADGRYDPQWDDSPVKGDTISIRLPIYASARRGEQADPQSLQERSVQLTIPPAYGSDSFLTDRQLSMELNDFKEQVLEPHIDAVSSAIAKAACKTMALGVSNVVGVPGAGAPTSLDTYQDAHTLLSQGGTPTGFASRNMLVNAVMDQKAAAAGRTFYNPTDIIGEQYKTGSMTGLMGLYGGAKWYQEEALYQHVVGTLGGTPRINGTVASGSISINLKGFSASVTRVLGAGDKLSFALCFQVHPVLGSIYATLQNFTVAQDVDSDGAGNCTVILTEKIETFPSPYANVSAMPLDNALVNVWNQNAAGQAAIAGVTTTLGILMHKSSLVFASPNMILPSDVDKLSGRTRSKIMKIGMRIWRASEVRGGDVITRLDSLVGHLVGQPRKACLIAM